MFLVSLWSFWCTIQVLLCVPGHTQSVRADPIAFRKLCCCTFIIWILVGVYVQSDSSVRTFDFLMSGVARDLEKGVIINIK